LDQGSIQESQVPDTCKSRKAFGPLLEIGAKQKKRPHHWGHVFKEAIGGKVREDFARYRSVSQNEV